MVPAVLDSLFAVNKPASITSAQVLRNLQAAFATSNFFTPWLAAERKRLEGIAEKQCSVKRERHFKRVDQREPEMLPPLTRNANSPAPDISGEIHEGCAATATATTTGAGISSVACKGKGKVKANYSRLMARASKVQIKMGHGGTLDPMATGVLVVGVGRGTRELSTMINCKKTYEATLLLGASTDTYDSEGRVTAYAEYSHVTSQVISRALDSFRGSILQYPPVYSAVKQQGKPLYKYAREGLTPPREISARSVQVYELDLLEWLAGGTHDYTFPEPIKSDEQSNETREELRASEPDFSGSHAKATISTNCNTTVQSADELLSEMNVSEAKEGLRSNLTSENIPGNMPRKDKLVNNTSLPPAIRLRVTASSGFYVRSLCHDLAKAVGSLGHMIALRRTRQGIYSLEEGNVLPYDLLVSNSESEWAPHLSVALRKSAEWLKSSKIGKNEGENECRKEK